jgi:diguanylate cyclase (GGDEF)-like protein
VPDAATSTRDEHAAFLKSIAQVDWLALAVVALYFLADESRAAQPVVVLSAMGGFALFVLAFRSRRFPVRTPRARIVLGAAVTIAFITLIATQSGGSGSPLVHLYLLPVILAAVTLGRRGTATIFLASAVCWVGLIVHDAAEPVPDVALFARLLGELGPFALVAYLTQRLAGSILSAHRQITELAERDGLTGLINLRSFEDLLRREHELRSAAPGGAYAVLMADMDRLKHVNDSWGHEAGNKAIRTAAEAIQRAVRSSDVAARYGGDEFTVFLPEATPEVAESVAQRIRNIVYQSLFQAGGRLQRVTVSVGVGCYPRDGRTAEAILAAADKRMYRDKSLRRERGGTTPSGPGQS